MPLLYFAGSMFMTAVTYLMARPDSLVQAGSTVVGTIDCINSAENGLTHSTSPSPVQACHAAGEMVSHVIGTAEAHEGPVDPQNLPRVKDVEPRAPIAS